MNKTDHPTRRLKVDLSELASILDMHEPELTHYLDLETGDTIVIPLEIRHELEHIYDDYYEDDAEAFDLAALLPELDYPDWQKEVLLQADQVEKEPHRYAEIPTADSHQGFEDMEDFIESVSHPQLQRRLVQALRGRGPFRAFKDALLNYPAERERWFAFKDERMEQRALDWLEKIGVEVIQDVGK